jgi:hypothetical protein
MLFIKPRKYNSWLCTALFIKERRSFSRSNELKGHVLSTVPIFFFLVFIFEDFYNLLSLVISAPE